MRTWGATTWCLKMVKNYVEDFLSNHAILLIFQKGESGLAKSDKWPFLRIPNRDDRLIEFQKNTPDKNQCYWCLASGRNSSFEKIIKIRVCVDGGLLGKSEEGGKRSNFCWFSWLSSLTPWIRHRCCFFSLDEAFCSLWWSQDLESDQKVKSIITIISGRFFGNSHFPS